MSGDDVMKQIVRFAVGTCSEMKQIDVTMAMRGTAYVLLWDVVVVITYLTNFLCGSRVKSGPWHFSKLDRSQHTLSYVYKYPVLFIYLFSPNFCL